MPLSKQELAEAKNQLREKIKDLPPQQKQLAESQIDNISEDELEAFVEQQRSQNVPIFRKIVNKEIPSIIVGENEKALAVLSVKAISKGHTIVIPKNPIQSEAEMPPEINQLTEQISKKIILGLKAKSTSIIPEKSFGEIIINIIPIYDKQLSLQSAREDKSINELEEIKKQINVEVLTKAPPQVIKKPRKRKTKPIKLPRQIP